MSETTARCIFLLMALFFTPHARRWIVPSSIFALSIRTHCRMQRPRCIAHLKECFWYLGPLVPIPRSEHPFNCCLCADSCPNRPLSLCRPAAWYYHADDAGRVAGDDRDGQGHELPDEENDGAPDRQAETPGVRSSLATSFFFLPQYCIWPLKFEVCINTSQ